MDRLGGRVGISRDYQNFTLLGWIDNHILLLMRLPSNGTPLKLRSSLARSGAPWVRKFGYLSIQEILVVTKSSVRSSTIHVSRSEILALQAPRRVLAVNGRPDF